MKDNRWMRTWLILISTLLASGALLLAFIGGHSPSATGSEQVPSAPARLSKDQAISHALNDFTVLDGEITLHHPNHLASFSQNGLTFTPARGGPAWRWQLAFVGAGDAPLPAIPLDGAAPATASGGLVRFSRGPLLEQYLALPNSLEQQFILPAPLPLDGADLVIEGQVSSTGAFTADPDGWSWHSSEGAVHLGDVRVFDAAGALLPASMTVSHNRTRITVDGVALAQAAYPVTIDPEIGANDFRISDMGGDDIYGAFNPTVAYNSTDNQYLVVWEGDDNTGALVDGEFEIYGQLIDATTGAEIGSDFRISDMGPDAAAYDASLSAVAYNSTDNQYLVVWEGDDNTGALVDGEFEIYGQLLDGATGAEIGHDFRISDMGPDGDAAFDTTRSAVAYNSTNNQYLVVWEGDDDTGTLVDGEFEIYGQLLDASGAEIGSDFRISDMGSNGDPAFDALAPAVAYNSTLNQYLVVWSGDDDSGSLVDEEFEIYGQKLLADGTPIGTNDLRLSDMGAIDGDPDYDALNPAVVHNSTQGWFLVVWVGDDDTGILADGEFEIYGQLVDGASENPIGTNDLRLSDMGPDGDPSFGARNVDVTFNNDINQYLVVWNGDDDTGSLVDNEFEIFAQLLDASGAELGTNDLRLSDMGPDGDAAYDAFSPAVAYASSPGEYLVVWRGDDNTGGSVDEEFEIFGQRVHWNGSEVGSNDHRLSDMGPDGDAAYDAQAPALVYNGTQNERFLVWYGDDDTAPLVEGELEIFGQRLHTSMEDLGTNDFRVSDMGGDTIYSAQDPAAAYNSVEGQYLVVWQGDDNTGALVDGEFEIFGQLIDTATGAEIGTDLRLSDMGPDGDVAYGAFDPAVAYNSTDNEYLIVWWGDDDTAPLIDGEFEIFGQLIDGATGIEIGTDFRISDMGPDANTSYNAQGPAVAYNSTANEYLVVWYGDDDTPPLIDQEIEIFGQLLDASGNPVGANDFRISSQGADGDTDIRVNNPAVTYNTTDNHYLVVWQGSNLFSFGDHEFEIFGQLLETGGNEIGSDFRISDVGAPGDTSYDAFGPAAAYNSLANQYLVVWYGWDDTPPLVLGETEIFGQLVNAGGTQIGTDDFRISNFGPDGDEDYVADHPGVAYDEANNEYLVVWEGASPLPPPLFDEESEIYGQRLDASGDKIETDFVLSDMGPDGVSEYAAFRPNLAYSSDGIEYLIVWYGDDDTPPLVDEELEIFGQRYVPSFKVYLPVMVR